MLQFLKRLFRTDAPEEHHIVLGNGLIEVAYNATTKVVFVIDQTGSDTKTMEELQAWCEKQGWFLHAVIVNPPSIINRDLKHGN